MAATLARTIPLLFLLFAGWLISSALVRLVAPLSSATTASCLEAPVEGAASDAVGVAELCFSPTGATAAIQANHLGSERSYTMLLSHIVRQTDSVGAVFVVDTVRADATGTLQAGGELPGLRLTRGSSARAELLELPYRNERGPYGSSAIGTPAKHRVDAFPEAETSTAVAHADFQVP